MTATKTATKKRDNILSVRMDLKLRKLIDKIAKNESLDTSSFARSLMVKQLRKEYDVKVSA